MKFEMENDEIFRIFVKEIENKSIKINELFKIGKYEVYLREIHFENETLLIANADENSIVSLTIDVNYINLSFVTQIEMDKGSNEMYVFPIRPEESLKEFIQTIKNEGKK